jgi:threonine/homoserine/homoserine lactone efflux protein|tara:strand:+ start:349 stop:960 length:612 start_codon:yes stop_codon:yes gene_type:complete
MDFTTLISLSIAAFIFGISPGPGTLAALSISTTRGLRSGLILSAGEAVGDVTYLTLAILSLGYLAQILEPAMIVVRWLGAGYLIYLGISQFRLASLNINSNTPSSKNLIRLFFMGFLIGGTNPKVILFYLSFIPLFIDLSNIDLTTGLQIASTVYVSVFASLVVVCIAGNQIKSWINKPRSIKILNRITGTMMIFVGLLLVVS